MATLQEYYIHSETNYHGIGANSWCAQTFTAESSYIIGSVYLLLSRYTSPGVATVSIYATSGGEPTGSALTTATFDADGITQDAAGEWKEIQFNQGYSIVDGTLYAIVVSSVSGDLRWHENLAGTYTGGNRLVSSNSGSTWTPNTARDFGFKNYDTTGGGVFSPSSDKSFTKRYVAIANNELWYESSAGTMEELTAANSDIDTSEEISAANAFQKLFIVNGTNFKVADFVNTKIITADVGTNPPDFGTVITGASGASMIVDYITATSSACTIYGKRTTTTTFTASDTITGTNPSTSAYGSAVSFTMTAVAEVAPPHWYDWTVFGADATNYGTMPTKAYNVCRYRGRLQITVDPNYPHQWYQTRQLNPFDFLHEPGNAQSPVAGNDSDCGEVGDIIKVAIPYHDDYLVYGCANEIWYLSGDAAFGGELNILVEKSGILGSRSWCWDNNKNLYLMCISGLLRIPVGFQEIENLTIDKYPDFVTDLAFDGSLHRIVLEYDVEKRGVHIFKTTLSDGTCTGWWYDLRTEGIFIDTIPTAMGIFCGTYYETADPDYRKTIFGCNDGYLKFFDPTAENDDGTLIDSYVGFAPLALSTSPTKDGLISNIDIVSAGGGSSGTQSDSNDIYCKVWTERTAEKVIEQLAAGTTPKITKTFSAPGFSKSNKDRRKIRGKWCAIVIGNGTVDETWAMEKLIVDHKEDGRTF